MSVDIQYEDIGQTSVFEPNIRTTIENIIFMILTMGIVLVLGGYWNIESVLWNRIPYGTGDKSIWDNGAPKFSEQQGWSLAEVTTRLQNAIILYSLGAFILLLGIGYILYLLIIKKKWDKKVQVVTFLAAIASAFQSFTAFWINQSIRVISSSRDYNPDNVFQSITGNPTGYDWIRGEIPNYANFLTIFTWVIVAVFLLIFIYCVYQLIYQRQLKKQKEKEELQIQDENKLNTIFQNIVKNIPFYVVLMVYLIFTLFPVYIVIRVSLSSPKEIQLGNNPSQLLDRFIMNYSAVMFAVPLDEPSFSGAFLRSLTIGLGTGILGLIVSLSAAYALARFRFKGNKFLTWLILSTQMFPGIILLLPQFVIWVAIGLHNSLIGLLLASAAGSLAYCTWMMKGYFETIPLDIEEAATIDGSSRFGNFIKIAVPLAKSGFVAVLIFTFITSWQDFVMARTLITDNNKYTLPLLLDNYENSAVQDAPPFFELLAPYSILVALPIVLFFMFMQKDLAKGAVAGSVK